MDQGKTHIAKRPFLFCLFMGLTSMLACKDRGEGPKSPEAAPAVAEGSLTPGTSDSNPQKPVTNETPAPTPAGANTLPDKFMTGLVECQKAGKYYDLQTASCTEAALADYPCDLTVLLSEASAVLNAGQKQLLKDYVEKNLQGFSLYACTVEEAKPALHFYKVEADKIRAHNVKIASP